MIILSTNAVEQTKVVPDFRHGAKIHCDRETFPIFKIQHLFTHNISKNRHIKVVALGFNASLTAKVISWRSVTHICVLAFSRQY